MTNTRTTTKNMVIAALCVALGLLLPFLTGQIQQFGQMLCPMHFPIFICGMICGWRWGLAAGFATPLLRHVLFGMPPMPGALFMAFELAAYGLFAGLLVAAFTRKGERRTELTLAKLYAALIIAMLAGRIVYGIVRYVFAGVNGTSFTLPMWLAAEFTGTWPGIVLQLLIIPPLVKRLAKVQQA